MKKVSFLVLMILILGLGVSISHVSGEDKCKPNEGSLIFRLDDYQVAQSNYPCPSGYVYCEHYRCGEGYCCPWGYFYSNSCTCNCYRSLEEARADCPEGAVFQCR